MSDRRCRHHCRCQSFDYCYYYYYFLNGYLAQYCADVYYDADVDLDADDAGAGVVAVV